MKNLLSLFPDQSMSIPGFLFGLGSENWARLSSRSSIPVIVSSQRKTKEGQLVVLQGFFTVLDKYRWMDSLDWELLLHGGEVVLHLLPTGTSYSTNSPKRSPSIQPLFVCCDTLVC